MRRDLTREELDRLGLSVNLETGEILQNGKKVDPLLHRTKEGLSYPKVSVYDPFVYRRTKKFGNRNILAARIVYAYAFGDCPEDCYVKAKNRDIFDLRPENLYLVKRRGTRK